MAKLIVGWMYPNLLNLHGERGSIQALTRIGQQLNVEIEVRRIEDFDDPVSFDEFDLLMFLPGEITVLEQLVLPLKAEGLDKYLERGGYLLAIGTSGLIFGNSITREDGIQVKGLGYLDMTAKERKYVWGDDLHFKINGTDMELAGAQIQMADVDAKAPLGTTVYGMGNNNTGGEGARWKNLIYTNCLGPLFVKNPWFAESIIKEIMHQKGVEIQGGGQYPIAKNSFEATLKFIQTKPKK